MCEIDPKKYFLLVMILITLICSLSYGIINRVQDEKIYVQERIDTIYELIIFYDTIIVEKPVEKKVIKLKTDTILLTERDTVVFNYEQKIYEDSSYTAYVSGVNPCLDSIKLYNKEVFNTVDIRSYLTKIVYKNKKFSVGPYVGIGTSDFREYKPEIGVGIHWNIFSF